MSDVEIIRNGVLNGSRVLSDANVFYFHSETKPLNFKSASV